MRRDRDEDHCDFELEAIDQFERARGSIERLRGQNAPAAASALASAQRVALGFYNRAMAAREYGAAQVIAYHCDLGHELIARAEAPERTRKRWLVGAGL